MARDDLGHGPLADDAAAVHDREAVREGLGLVEVVRGQHDRGAPRAERGDQLPGAGPGLRVQARGGLVEEQQLGIARDRAGEVQAPHLAAGERRDAGAGAALEVDLREHLGDGARRGEGRAPHREGLGGGEIGGEAAGLQHEPLAGAHCAPVPVGVQPEHAHGAAGGAGEPLEHLEGRGLAGAVGAEQSEQLPAPDLEIDRVDREVRVLPAAIAAGEGLGADDRPVGHRVLRRRPHQRSPRREAE
jgi:hypothetical protein